MIIKCKLSAKNNSTVGVWKFFQMLTLIWIKRFKYRVTLTAFKLIIYIITKNTSSVLYKYAINST